MFNIFKLDVLIVSWICISYIVRKLLVEMFVGHDQYDEKNWHAEVLEPFFLFLSALFVGGLVNFAVLFFIIISATSTISHLGWCT